MKFVSMREFTSAPKETQKKLAADGELIITNNGTPTMLVIDIENRDFLKMIDYLRRQEALDILYNIGINIVSRPSKINMPDETDRKFYDTAKTAGAYLNY